MALCNAVLNDCRAAVWKRGGSSPLKSAPTRLNDSPKYMHWPSSESRRFPTPRSKSFSKVFKNCWTYMYELNNKKFHATVSISTVALYRWIICELYSIFAPSPPPKKKTLVVIIICFLSNTLEQARIQTSFHCSRKSINPLCEWLKIHGNDTLGSQCPKLFPGEYTPRPPNRLALVLPEKGHYFSWIRACLRIAVQCSMTM